MQIHLNWMSWETDCSHGKCTKDGPQVGVTLKNTTLAILLVNYNPIHKYVFGAVTAQRNQHNHDYNSVIVKILSEQK